MNGRIEKRIERLENQSMEREGLPLITYHSYYQSEVVPDVFDRPIHEWEIFRQMGDAAFLAVDPVAEAKARGGQIPDCPVARYDQWRDQQNSYYKPKHSINVVKFNSIK